MINTFGAQECTNQHNTGCTCSLFYDAAFMFKVVCVPLSFACTAQRAYATIKLALFYISWLFVSKMQ